MTEERKPGYQYSCTVDLGQGKQIQIIGNFLKDATEQEMSAELDKNWSVLNRQRVRLLELPAAQQSLHEQEQRLDELEREAGKMDLKGQAGRLSTAEKSQRDNQLTTIEKLREVIPHGRKFVADLEQKAA